MDKHILVYNDTKKFASAEKHLKNFDISEKVAY